MDTLLSRAQELLNKEFDTILDQLVTLVRIPSVSWPEFDGSFVDESAQYVASMAKDFDFFDSVEVLQAPIGSGPELGKPAVVARKEPGAGWPTVLLYAHHDVQPPGNEDFWASPAFEPTFIGERLYARGAADDKAGILVHLAAIQLLDKLLPEHTLGVVLFIEGEEEYGSPSFISFLETYRDKLTSEVIIVADSGNWSTEIPALTSSLRGNVAFNLEVSTLDHALHSGMFGGVAPDAMMALSLLISSFYDAEGNVVISGINSTSSDNPEYPQEQFREEAGVLSGVSLIGDADIAAQLWLRPAVTVTGIDFPSLAHASNTLNPSVTARISIRVPPGVEAQDAYEAIQSHLQEHNTFNAHMKYSEVSLGNGYLVDKSSSSYRSYTQVLSDVWNVEPVNMGVGGSIPFISSFVETFPSAHVLVTGVEDPDSRAHSPNESLHIPSFKKGILSEFLFLARQTGAVEHL
jgi:acetylornithine deacetylase/succinyl-diaminopimelate desuccinylase-like protein